MKKLIIGSSLLFSIFSIGYAAPIQWQPVTSGAPMPSYGSSEGYQGSSGAQYQYDLNNPVERNQYSIDLDAQRRDMQKIAPGSLDNLRGQNGGGYGY